MTDGRPLGEPWEFVTFEKFYFEHYARVVSVLFRLTSSRTEAEDLANEVFWKLYRRQLLPNPDGNVAGWVYRTATNLGIDCVLRKNARRRQHEHEASRLADRSHSTTGPLDEVLRAEERQAVRRALAELNAGAGSGAHPASQRLFLPRNGGGARRKAGIHRHPAATGRASFPQTIPREKR